MPQHIPFGIQSVASPYSVNETVARLEALFKAKGIKLFCLVDHSGEALAAGLQMPPTKLLIFGNPIAGTPVMLSAPSTALDLPLRILVAQSATDEAAVVVSWNAPAWLQQRHGFADDLLPNLAAAGIFAAKAVE